MPKTRSSERDIPISKHIVSLIKEAQKKAKGKYVVSDSENFVSPRTFDYRYRTILTEAGIKIVNYHILRHTFATRCIRSGMDIKTLSEILGHSNVSITLNTYVHSSIEQKRLQLEKLD